MENNEVYNLIVIYHGGDKCLLRIIMLNKCQSSLFNLQLEIAYLKLFWTCYLNNLFHIKDMALFTNISVDIIIYIIYLPIGIKNYKC